MQTTKKYSRPHYIWTESCVVVHNEQTLWICVQGLNLKNNKLKKIARRSFEGLRHLTDLSLDGNEISQIESSSFFDLQNVKYLTATMNALKDVDYFSFQGLSKVKYTRTNNYQYQHTFLRFPNLSMMWFSRIYSTWATTV